MRRGCRGPSKRLLYSCCCHKSLHNFFVFSLQSSVSIRFQKRLHFAKLMSWTKESCVSVCLGAPPRANWSLFLKNGFVMQRSIVVHFVCCNHFFPSLSELGNEKKSLQSHQQTFSSGHAGNQDNFEMNMCTYPIVDADGRCDVTVQRITNTIPLTLWWLFITHSFSDISQQNYFFRQESKGGNFSSLWCTLTKEISFCIRRPYADASRSEVAI